MTLTLTLIPPEPTACEACGRVECEGTHVVLSRQLSLADVEAAFIAQVLEDCGGNISQAAIRLGIYRSSLQRRLRREPLATLTGRRRRVEGICRAGP